MNMKQVSGRANVFSQFEALYKWSINDTCIFMNPQSVLINDACCENHARIFINM